jgi:hypothetical protein
MITPREFLEQKLGSDLPKSMGTKITALIQEYMDITIMNGPAMHWYEKKVGQKFEVVGDDPEHEAHLVLDDKGKERFVYKRDCEQGLNVDSHYDNTGGSLYKFAEKYKLNSYEFEVIKRTVRCRKKGEFISDIEKTIRVLQIYLKEQRKNYKGQVEKLN